MDESTVINTSGQGNQAIVPPEIKKWNWGAFFLNWIWGVGNSTYIAFLMFIPLVNIVMLFVLGAKGSEWAWKHRMWRDVAHFKSVQRKWAMAGLALWIVAGIVLGFTITAFVHASRLATETADAFFKNISSGQVEAAYNSTAKELKATDTLADLQTLISDNPILKQVRSESFDEQKFHMGATNTAFLRGTLTGNDGTVVPVTILELKEDGVWKVASVDFGQDGVEQE